MIKASFAWWFMKML